jgi:geranylgeranylglycerol-phosphate geranylgeranyltransferase
MVFITSPFNDVADVEGDRAAGRKTIPIVIGRENTVKLSIFLSIGMITTSWLLPIVIPVGIITSICVTLVALLTIVGMTKTLKRLGDRDYVRKQHKKSMPLHLVLQMSLVIGSLLFWMS